MSRNTSIILGDHFSDFIAEQVRDGRYGSASEVVRAGLRLLEERETELQALREAIREGVESGAASDLDFDELLRELNAEHGA